MIDLWRQSNCQEISPAQAPAASITDAVLNIFECWIRLSNFDPRLDFAMREWSRLDLVLHRTVQEDDVIHDLFKRHGFDETDARVCAWVICFTQMGYHAVEPGETEPERALLTNSYLLAFTGQTTSRDRITACHARVLADPPHVRPRTSPA